MTRAVPRRWFDDPDQARRAFDALATNGKVDAFGIHWMFNSARVKQA